MDYLQITKKLGIKSLLPIQEKLIESVENHPNLGLYAPTGSGKTLAFLLTLIKSQQKYGWTNTLIIAPTRELAIQLHKVCSQLDMSLTSTLCYGGHQFSVERNNLKANPNIIIGTPGRIADHIRRETFDFKTIEALIVDEEDKVYELGFEREMNEIIDGLGEIRFSIQVSATGKTKAIKGQKKLFIVDERQEASLPDFSYYRIGVQEEEHKALALLNLLQSIEPSKTLVFFNHKEAITRISNYLFQHDFESTVFHGGLEQEERERNLIKFSNGTVDLLLVTDLAARGIDIPEIKNIVHYQFPKDEAAFIHRNGRTARMGETGNVFCIAESKELKAIDYLNTIDFKEFKLNKKHLHWISENDTLYFSLGKKDKVNKIDILGFLTKELGFSGKEVGKIETLDFATFVAVNRGISHEIIQRANGKKIKKQTVKIRLSK